MSEHLLAAEACFASLVDALLGEAGVSLGSSDGVRPKRGFGASALRVNNKIFAMLAPRGEFVVKLPEKRVDAVIAAGHGERFDPGHGRLMKEWLALTPGADLEWLPLAREALAYVVSKR